jgi:hypothetical protein
MGAPTHAQPKPRSESAQVQEERNWIRERRQEEMYIDDAGEFYNGPATSKMVHALTDGGARPNPGPV